MCKERKYLLFILAVLLAWSPNTFGQKPVISSVSVEPSGAVKINWFPVTGVRGYKIYRDSIKINETGFNPIDSVLGENNYEYIDNEADARKQSIGYFIQFLDSTEHSDPHFTIYLNPIKYDSCSNTNTLTWNGYKNWSSVYYKIKDKYDNDIEDFLSDTTYVHVITPGQDYHYSIKAVNNISPSFTSYSNKDSIFATPLDPPSQNEFYINTITNYGDSVGFSINIDINADLLGHFLMGSNNENSGFSELSYQDINSSSVIQFGHMADNQPFYYKVNALGVCADTVMSTQVVQPIVMDSKSDETEVTLNWNQSFIESTENYSMSVVVDGGAPTVLSPPNGLSETYIFNNLGTETSEVYCFSLLATDINNNTSQSNEVCVSRMPKIEPPTAFTPNRDGLNDYFGPFWEKDNENSYIKNAIVEEIKIKIYDKYGGVVFSTDKANRRWDGAIKGRYVPEGGYIYYLWFKTAQGKTYEKSGTINVVYP